MSTNLIVSIRRSAVVGCMDADGYYCHAGLTVLYARLELSSSIVLDENL